MIQKLTVTVLLMAMLMSGRAFAQKIVAIGSSTVSGEGSNPRDSAWLNLLDLYYTNAGFPVNFTNLGWSGTTTFAGMPSSFATPTTDPTMGVPFLGHNITYALSLNPDIVIIAYPSNDLVLGYTIPQYLANLRTIYDSALALGKKAFVATTQPRNDVNGTIRSMQVEARDSILAEFPGHAFNFWDPLADPVTLGFKTGLTDDGIHPNNAGHQLLFQVARNANILDLGPLAETITDFRAKFQDRTVVLQWKSALANGSVTFWIQRSGNGVDFEDLYPLATKAGSTLTDLSWTDASPLPGNSFYRLRIAEQSSVSYSGVASILNTADAWKVGKLYSPNGSTWNIEVFTGKTVLITVHVVDAVGRAVLERSAAIAPPSAIVPLDLSRAANGEYFIQLSATDGGNMVRAIQKK